MPQKALLLHHYRPHLRLCFSRSLFHLLHLLLCLQFIIVYRLSQSSFNRSPIAPPMAKWQITPANYHRTQQIESKFIFTFIVHRAKIRKFCISMHNFCDMSLYLYFNFLRFKCSGFRFTNTQYTVSLLTNECTMLSTHKHKMSVCIWITKSHEWTPSPSNNH